MGSVLDYGSARQTAMEKRIRAIPLHERLAKCQQIIGSMCAQRRPPRMTIPPQWDDEDLFLSITLRDAQDLASKGAREVEN